MGLRLIPPSRKIWWDTAHAYQVRAVEHLCERGSAALFLDPGLGKLNPVSEPIYTPTGWRRIGDVRVGDYVTGVNGKPTRVIGVFPQTDRRVWRVTFSDGAWCRCGPDHLWTVAGTNWSAQQPLENKRAWQTLTTQEILNKGVLRPKPDGRRGAYWRIPIASPVEHAEAALPVAPWLFGAWLGNGYDRTIVFDARDAALRDRAVAEMGPYARKTTDKPTLVKANASAEWGRRVASLVGGALSKDKHIPELYKRASIAQRTELLRGLMDTDGSCVSNRVTFHSCSPSLANDVAELVRSLGGVAKIREHTRDAEGNPTEWQVNVKTTFCPFYSERKAEQWRPHKLSRIIVDISPDGEEDSVCILVEDPLHLYITRNFIVTHNTSVTLAAFKKLREEGSAKRMLVIAPMRVCQLVWGKEANKWYEFQDLKFANMAGKPADVRKRLLNAKADIWLINPESVPWLCDQFFGGRLPFDIVVIDELTKFKNGSAGRSKKLQPLMDKVARRWGLTGTPVPNGYMDLFGQMRIIDSGASLGVYITHFRDRFFQQGRDGFSYDLRPGAEKAIEAAIAPYVFRASAEDYLTLPPLVDNPIYVELEPAVMKQYKQLKKDMLLSLNGAVITAANSAAVYTKLQQFTGGAVYVGGEDGEYARVHDAKLDALEELVEELNGQPLFVAYYYKHELERLLERFPNARYLGSGVSAKDAEAIERDWNEGKIPILFGHPASVGHGLNFQLGNAANICWYTQTWNYELYDQFIRRVHRQGNGAERIFNHKLVVRDTIDELVEEALNGKETTQDAFLEALKSELIPDKPKEQKNMARLVQPGQPAPQGHPQTTWITNEQANAEVGGEQATAPRGWGAFTGGGPQPSAGTAQREMIQAKVAPTGWSSPTPAHQPTQAQPTQAQPTQAQPDQGFNGWPGHRGQERQMEIAPSANAAPTVDGQWAPPKAAPEDAVAKQPTRQRASKQAEVTSVASPVSVSFSFDAVFSKLIDVGFAPDAAEEATFALINKLKG